MAACLNNASLAFAHQPKNSRTMHAYMRACVRACVPRNINVPTHPPRQDTAVAVCTRVLKLGPRVNAAISG